MKSILQHLLGKLCEEGLEVGQMAQKCEQFGLNEIKVGETLHNAARLHSEIDDFMAAIEQLNAVGLGYVPSRERIEAKKVKVKKYLKLSQSLGMVEPGDIPESDTDQ